MARYQHMGRAAGCAGLRVTLSAAWPGTSWITPGRSKTEPKQRVKQARAIPAAICMPLEGALRYAPYPLGSDRAATPHAVAGAHSRPGARAFRAGLPRDRSLYDGVSARPDRHAPFCRATRVVPDAAQ